VLGEIIAIVVWGRLDVGLECHVENLKSAR
jgi:hypothetical protein